MVPVGTGFCPRSVAGTGLEETARRGIQTAWSQVGSKGGKTISFFVFKGRWFEFS